jgi:hypothetical protein
VCDVCGVDRIKLKTMWPQRGFSTKGGRDMAVIC